MERSKQVEHQEDVQQRYFDSYQPKFPKQQHRYPTRSKNTAYEVETIIEKEENPTVEDKEFVFLRDNEEKEPVFRQFEFIFRNKLGEPRVDHEGNKVVVIGPLPTDVISRVFLTKPDERGAMN